MRKTISIGKISSVTNLVIIIFYYLLQILFVLKIVPGPGNSYWFVGPFILLAFAFLITTVCIDILVPETSRKWTVTAWALATVNCILLVMIVVSQPNLLHPAYVHTSAVHNSIVSMAHPSAIRTMKYTVCFLISASTFFLAFAFKQNKNQWLHRVLLVNGVTLPIACISFLFQAYQLLLSCWILIFSVTTILIYHFFTKEERKSMQAKANLGIVDTYVVK